MADKKISALPAASTPLAGTEVLPIVQGGITEQVSVANLTAGRSVSASNINVSSTSFFGSDMFTVQNGGIFLNGSANYAGASLYSRNTGLDFVIAAGGIERFRAIGTGDGNISVVTGNVIIGTAGKGIDFSANTHAAGMTSELLNDYEEGTWTPTLTSDGTPPTVTGYASRYGSYTKIGNRVYISVNIRATVTAVGTGTPQVTGFPYAAKSGTLNGISLGLTDLMSIPFNGNFMAGSTLVLASATYTLVTNGYLTFTAMYEID